MIGNGLNKYVTEMPEEKQEHRNDEIGAQCGERAAAKARPKQTSLPMSSSPKVKIPLHMRERIDVEPGEYDQRSFEVSEKLIRLLRHDGFVLREETEQLNSKFWYRCLPYNSSPLRIGQSEHG